jgi:hypothetical protein
MRGKSVVLLAAGLFALGALPRAGAAQQKPKAQVEQPEITVYKVPT